tara:strand:- start:486 stop:701 length:216 start_codon:yes stop_codon:yes gene_type:complete
VRLSSINKTGDKIMDIVKKLLSEMDDGVKNDIYLREIALLMEQIEDLKGKIRVKENIIKSFELGLEGKKDE